MIRLEGSGVSRGIAIGRLHILRPAAAPQRAPGRADPASEKERFLAARDRAAAHLGALAEEARRRQDEEAAQLLEAHRAMAEDPELEEEVLEAILERGEAAEEALMQAAGQFSDMFSAMDDPYFQARSADVRDIAERIREELTGVSHELPAGMEPVILAAEELAPSAMVQLDGSRLLGLALSGGSPLGHTSILARSRGIPAAIGLGAGLLEAAQGTLAILDGDAGVLLVDPDDKTLAAWREKAEGQKRERAALEALKSLPSQTRDGRRIRICCNISGPEDVEAAEQNGADGVGLFRSEFLYLRAADFPSEDEQYQAYRQVLEAMQGKEVIIRTLDIGADKQIGYLGLPKEENPALGNRALRLCLERPEIFRTQLRALYRASVHGRLSIMFPMVTSVWEVQEARRLCRQVREELSAEGLESAPCVPTGIMIETPAAALISDELAREADFFSLGTNDLTQYILACDRQEASLARFYDPHHPALVRALRMAVESAHRNGIWAGICGDLAADLTMTEMLVEMGFDELSVAPSAVLPLRQRVREI